MKESKRVRKSKRASKRKRGSESKTERVRIFSCYFWNCFHTLLTLWEEEAWSCQSLYTNQP